MTSNVRQRVSWRIGRWALGVVIFAASCAPKPPSLPTGTSTPFPDFPSAYRQATAACEHTTTITLSMALSGKAGSMKLRERIAPFGKPVFVLVADGARGTLVLPREDRVLTDASPDRIVEALAGVPLGAEDLRT